MRITRIAAENFLSFESLDVGHLDPQMNVVVGPNGSGKSNIIRLLSVVRDVAGWPSNSSLRREDLLGLRRLGTNTGFSLAVALELTEDGERTLVANFLRGAILSSDLPSSYSVTFPEEWSEWTEKALRDDPSFLFQGTLRVVLPDKSDADPHVTFECEAKEISLAWSATEGIGRSGVGSSVRPAEAFQRSRDAAIGGLAALFSRGDRVSLELRPNKLSEHPGILRQLKTLTGEELDSGQNRFYTGAWLFHQLFRNGLYLTDNIRARPRLKWTAKDLTRSPESLDLRDGSALPLYLFRLRTGHPIERETYGAVCSYFLDLTGIPLGITFKPSAPSPREARQVLKVGIHEPSGGPPPETVQEEFELVPVVETSSGDIPIEFAGAGAWEATILSAFLAAPGGVLVLDEPALNLHPTRQRRLLDMLRSRDRQVLLVTHSPYMVPADEAADLGRIIRLDLEKGTTRVCRIRPGSSAGREQTKWLRWLSELTEVRSFLFTRGVILVEGATEQGALSTWFAKSSEAQKRGAPEDLNLSVFSVGGDQKFQPFISLLKAFDIPWVVVCDGKVYRDRQEKGEPKVSIFRQLREAGIQLEEVAFKGANGFADSKRSGAACGVFTLVQDFREEFEDYLKSSLPRECAMAAEEWPKSKAMAGRMVAQETDCPKEVGDLYAQILDWFKISLRPPQGSGED